MIQNYNHEWDNSLSKLTGNIIPHHWYQTICNKSGKPNRIAISLLSEIVYWYRPTRAGLSKFFGKEWQTSYAYLEKKLCACRESIRSAFVMLERLGIIQRELKSIQVRGQTYNNVLFIKLIDTKFISSFENKSSSNISNSISSFNNKKICSSVPKYDTPSTKICGDIYKEEENKEENNRSRSDDLLENKNFNELISCSKSTLSFSPQIDLDMIETESGIHTNHIESELNIVQIKSNTSDKSDSMFSKIPQSLRKNTKRNIAKRKKLSEYLSLDEAIYKEILSRTQRDFSKEFVENLLKKLSEKYEEHSFINDSYFVKYMTKVLDNELLSEEAANNIEHKTENDYLATIEDSADTSRVGGLKRRIASMFDGKTAYRLLTEYQFPEKHEEGSFEYRISIKKEKKSIYKDLKEQGQELILSEYYRDLLLREVRNIFGNDINKIEVENIKECDIYSKMQLHEEESNKDIMFRSEYHKSKQDIESKSGHIQKHRIWGRAREKLIEKYGIEIDQSWFKKLDVSIDEEGKEARLVAPTAFIRDWIKNNYLREIEKTIAMLEPSIEICKVNVGMYSSSGITT